jgi:hypothetical protein
LDDALSLASTFADSRKAASADRIVELASATREFGELNDFPQLRRYGDQAAGSLDDLADYVAKTDIPDMLDDFAGFAMRKPRNFVLIEILQIRVNGTLYLEARAVDLFEFHVVHA